MIAEYLQSETVADLLSRPFVTCTRALKVSVAF